jgi:hypothetical protein
MSNLINMTSFAAATFVHPDAAAQLRQIVVVSAAFEARPGRPVRPVDEQPPVRVTDVCFGGPGASSVRYEAEVAWEKPRVDVVVSGARAYAPGGRARQVLVALRAGDVQKELLVSGDRGWRSLLLGGGPERPTEFETMPIVYERAFGGTDARAPKKAKVDVRNPIGVGFHGAASADENVHTRIPNVEYPAQLVVSSLAKPQPAGFGVIARGWQPRLALAGTYDDAWLKEQAPMLAHDFDVGHFQCAPADQQSATLKGGEPVELQNMTPDGLWHFTLPELDVPVRLRYADRDLSPALRTDTVVLEPESYRVTLLARFAVPVVRNRAPLEEIILGHVTPAWWRAKLRGKAFLDRAGTGGRAPGARDFVA